MKKKIGEIIKHYRNENNLSLRDFASRTSLSHSYISKLENNPDSELTIPSAKEIAKAMHMSVEELLALLDGTTIFSLQPNVEPVKYNNLVKMPVIGSIPAGTPLEAIQYIDDSDCLYIPKSRLRGGQENYFLLRIQGNSMNPKYLDGDVILFFINPSPDSGAEVAAMVNGDDATFKQIFISENGVTLHPYNSLFDDMHYSIEEIRELPVRVLGVAQSLEYRDLRG